MPPSATNAISLPMRRIQSAVKMNWGLSLFTPGSMSGGLSAG